MTAVGTLLKRFGKREVPTEGTRLQTETRT